MLCCAAVEPCCTLHPRFRRVATSATFLHQLTPRGPGCSTSTTSCTACSTDLHGRQTGEARVPSVSIMGSYSPAPVHLTYATSAIHSSSSSSSSFTTHPTHMLHTWGCYAQHENAEHYSHLPHCPLPHPFMLPDGGLTLPLAASAVWHPLQHIGPSTL